MLNIMNKKRIREKELRRREVMALELYYSSDVKKIEKNHKRILWLRKYLGISNKPRRISVAELLLQRMM